VFVNRSELLRARNAANEAAVIATLRAIASAEAMAQSSGVIDTDGDGQGEYGYFAELAGSVPCRVSPNSRRTVMEPPILSASFGKVTPAGNVLRTGYVYRMYLPGPTSNGKTAGIPESGGGGWATGTPRPSADNGEILWAVYAWPIETPGTGQHAYFMNQEGDMLVMDNADGAYSGEDHAPAFDAAFSTQSAGDMAAPPKPGAQCNDGHAWNLFDGQMPASEPPKILGPATAADLAINDKPEAKRSVVSKSLLARANQSTNEAGAIATLRVLLSAEAQLQASGAIDTDGDGTGEYGFIGEMAGTLPLRAAAGAKGGRLDPPLIGGQFATMSREGDLVRSGYVFRVYLPGARTAQGTPGITEAGGASSASQPDHDDCENLFVVYAWPLDAGRTGARVFFVNQEGDVLMTANDDHAYSGEEHAPAFDAAFSARKPGDMKAPMPDPGTRGNDGHEWSPAH
jgi:hypothetical protein